MHLCFTPKSYPGHKFPLKGHDNIFAFSMFGRSGLKQCWVVILSLFLILLVISFQLQVCLNDV